MWSTPAALETVSEFGQCIMAGRSMTPSVPAIRAVHVMLTRIAALTTPSLSFGVMQQRRDHLVDAGLAHHAVGHDTLDRPEHERAKLDGVDPEVEQRTATELTGEVPVGGVHRPPESEVGLDQQGLADATLADDVDQGTVGRKEAAPDGLHQEQPPAPGLLRHPCRLAGVERERLLAQDVLSGLEEANGVHLVTRVRGGDVDHVDIGIGGECVVVAVARRYVEAVAEGLGPLGRTRGHGRDGAALGPLHRLRESRGDAARADDAPADHGAVTPPKRTCRGRQFVA